MHYHSFLFPDFHPYPASASGFEIKIEDEDKNDQNMSEVEHEDQKEDLDKIDDYQLDKTFQLNAEHDNVAECAGADDTDNLKLILSDDEEDEMEIENDNSVKTLENSKPKDKGQNDVHNETDDEDQNDLDEKDDEDQDDQDETDDEDQDEDKDQNSTTSASNTSRLDNMKSVFEGLKLYKCPTCGRSFSTNQYLKVHSEKIHNNIKGSKKQFSCNMCGKVFIGTNGLLIHIRTNHEMSEPMGKMPIYPMDLLEMGWKNNYKTKNFHNKSSTKIKSFTCDNCKFFFANKIMLERHIYSVHKEDKILDNKNNDNLIIKTEIEDTNDDGGNPTQSHY